jgi:hypothetical protein
VASDHPAHDAEAEADALPALARRGGDPTAPNVSGTCASIDHHHVVAGVQ